MPPSHNALRTAGSPSLDCARRADSVSGESLPRKVFVPRRVGGKIFAQLRQPEFQRHLLQLGIDGLGIEKGLAQQRQPAVGIFGQTFAIGFGLFLPPRAPGCGQSGKGPSRGPRAPPSCHRKNRARDTSVWTLAMSLQGSPISAAKRGIRRHLGLEIGVGRALGGDQGRIDQRLLLAVIGLEAVLDAEQQIIGDAGMLGAFLGEADQAGRAVPRTGSGSRARPDRAGFASWSAVKQPLGRAGIAGDKDRLAVLGRRRAPDQMIRRLDGLAVFVEPHERAIEVIAGKVEIVRIAAEEGRLAFRREHQPDIGIFAIGVKLVLATLIQRDRPGSGICLPCRRSLPFPSRRSRRRAP